MTSIAICDKVITDLDNLIGEPQDAPRDVDVIIEKAEQQKAKMSNLEIKIQSQKDELASKQVAIDNLCNAAEKEGKLILGTFARALGIEDPENVAELVDKIKGIKLELMRAVMQVTELGERRSLFGRKAKNIKPKYAIEIDDDGKPYPPLAEDEKEASDDSHLFGPDEV